MILFGHPTGGPFSHHAALAHFEAGRLEAFCVPWMPTPRELGVLRRLPGLGGFAQRLERRLFVPLLDAPRVEDRFGEWRRLARRLMAAERNSEALAYEANDWLMATMRREAARRPGVTAVHAYEDCSLWQFEEATRRGQARIYDLPIGYYPAWEQTQAELERRYADWAPGSTGASAFVRPDQKRREIALADVVLAPSDFVRRTVHQFEDKPVAYAPLHGVDLDYWHPPQTRAPGEVMTFISVGQCSIRKGTPLLLQAWEAAALPGARLLLVGSWQMAQERMSVLPKGVQFLGPTSRDVLRGHLQAADVFVFPSYFEGLALALLEAAACGLPAIATDATSGPEVIDERSGRVIPAGDLDALVASLRWFASHREQLPAMGRAIRTSAERFTWTRYRAAVASAVAPFA